MAPWEFSIISKIRPLGESDATKAHRAVLAPPEEHGLVTIMGPDGMFDTNTVGAFGVVSAGGELGSPG